MLEKVLHVQVSFLFPYFFVVHKKDYLKATISSQKKQKQNEIPSKILNDWKFV